MQGESVLQLDCSTKHTCVGDRSFKAPVQLQKGEGGFDASPPGIYLFFFNLTAVVFLLCVRLVAFIWCVGCIPSGPSITWIHNFENVFLWFIGSIVECCLPLRVGDHKYVRKEVKEQEEETNKNLEVKKKIKRRE